MMVTLRLYRQHDLDLITLYKHPSFSLPAAIKRSLMAYVRQQQLIIKQPTPYKLDNTKIAKTVQIHIQLDETNDKDIIKWLKTTKEGYRNSVLKNIIRGYLAAPCIYSYHDEEKSLDLSLENNDLFEANIRNITEIKGRTATTRKTKNKDTRKVEDSDLAKEILNRKTVRSEKKEVVFVERIDDDDIKTPEVTKIEKPQEIKQPVTPQEEVDDADMFNMFDNLMDSM